MHTNRPHFARRALLAVALAMVAGTCAAAGAGQAHATEQAAAAEIVPARLSIGDATYEEGHDGTRPGRLSLSLSRPLTHDLVVTYRTIDGTATAGHDHRPGTGRAVLRAGQTWRPVRTALMGDRVLESASEHFDVEIVHTSDPSVELRKPMGRVVILDDDDPKSPPPTMMRASAAQVVEGDDRWRAVPVMISLSAPQPSEVSVEVRATSSEAFPRSEFAPLRQVVRIPAGRTMREALLRVHGDLDPEQTEAVSVELTPLGNPGITTSPGRVLILDDDLPPAPDAPADATAALRGPEAPGRVDIAWSDPTGGAPVDSYLVEVTDDAPGPDGTGARWTPLYEGDNQPIEHQCGVPTVTCRYRITARNRGGDGPAAVTAAITTQGVPGIPVAPTVRSTLALGSWQVAWNAPLSDGGAPVLDYIVSRVEQGVGVTYELKTGGLRSATVGCPSGATCWWLIRAVNGAGAGAAAATEAVGWGPAAPPTGGCTKACQPPVASPA